jgi:hypothetical protein
MPPFSGQRNTRTAEKVVLIKRIKTQKFGVTEKALRYVITYKCPGQYFFDVKVRVLHSFSKSNSKVVPVTGHGGL